MNEVKTFMKFVEAFSKAYNEGKKDFTCPLCGGYAWWNDKAMGCLSCEYRITNFLSKGEKDDGKSNENGNS